MEDWIYSRPSYNRTRLLGQIKAQYVYLKLCADHSLLSPTFIFNGGRKVVSDKHSNEMRELRESLRQAALINIVAAVNEDDKREKTRQGSNSTDNRSNPYGIQHLLKEKTDIDKERAKLYPRPMAPNTHQYTDKSVVIPPLRSSRTENSHSPRKFKVSNSFSGSYTPRELSILEGHGIHSPQQIETLAKKKRTRKEHQNNGCEKDLTLPCVHGATSVSNHNRQSLVCHNLAVAANGIFENPERLIRSSSVNPNMGEHNEHLKITHSAPTTSALSRQKEENETSETPEPVDKATLTSHSSQESDVSSSRECKENGTIRDTLHISTKEGDIGRSAGYFPPPSSVAKRDTQSRKQLAETRLPKCDAVDILDQSIATGYSEFPIIIKSQRDHLGEMGTTLFGLTRTNSLPSVSTQIKRQKKRPKRENELISLSVPLIRPTMNGLETLKDGIVGVNIECDSNHDIKRLPSPLLEQNVEDSGDVFPVNANHMGNSIGIYHLSNINTSKSPGLIKLEGQGLPTFKHTHQLASTRDQRPSHFTSSRYPNFPVVKPSMDMDDQSSHSPVSSSDTEPHLSKQLYDFRSLCIDSDPCVYTKFQTTKQIKPLDRKSGALSNDLSAMYCTPRTRPINASMSASKHLELKKKPYESPPATTLDPDEATQHDGSVDISITASKIKHPVMFQCDPEHLPEVTDNDLKHNQTTDSISDSTGTSTDDTERTTMDFMLDSDTDIICRVNTPKTPSIRNPSMYAKHQGISSTNPKIDKLTKLHIISDSGSGKSEATVKILKSLDQDIYADFTHRKHRKINYSNSSEMDSKVVKVKVKYPNTEVINNNTDSVKGTFDSDNEFELED
ncbi:hypothetical protein SNE40_011258 [Patella caerulea]|uniref:Uncharacterized protein n=1 Tax=Patella caerulea TaxID=87958 RepID=A0AAN8JNU7_PATCE